ncbi:MAG: IMPACT family protein [Clostridiales bacterium]|nr:IMPACT family protein [Clostridiales bacterium]
MKPYLTVLKAGQAEQTIERSRFIGHAFPAKTVTECETFFERIRKEHRQATHNVPAYVLGEGSRLQWAGDDGEPRGTSGAPIVHMLVGEGISDVAVMVTRYFGGVKLGTGGLVRAYTGTAKLALEAAGLGQVSERLVIAVETDYAGYHRIEAAAGGAFVIEDTEFAGNVTALLSVLPALRDAAVEQLHAAAPSARIVSERIRIVTVPVGAETRGGCEEGEGKPG